MTCRTVQHFRLKELDRLSPGVDLVQYEDESGVLHRAAFKFNPWNQPRRLQMAWDEPNLLMRLPPHPNLVPFDRIVLSDVESRVIGFTTKYIAGGTLEDLDTPFRVEWLRQLLDVVDFLNLDLSIIHRDIAPRNLLVDPSTNNILLFDFDWAARGNDGLQEGRSDILGVAFTIHELITGDSQFVKFPHWDRNIEMVQELSAWIPKRTLDTDVSIYRDLINKWITKRSAFDDNHAHLNAPHRISWPEMPSPPDYDVPYQRGRTAEGEPLWVTGQRSRKTARKLGQFCFCWERTSQCMLQEQESEDQEKGT